MAELVVLYKTPKDAAAFDKHYAETHIPLASRLPRLRRYTVSWDAAVVRGAPHVHEVPAPTTLGSAPSIPATTTTA